MGIKRKSLEVSALGGLDPDMQKTDTDTDTDTDMRALSHDPFLVITDQPLACFDVRDSSESDRSSAWLSPPSQAIPARTIEF